MPQRKEYNSNNPEEYKLWEYCNSYVAGGYCNEEDGEIEEVWKPLVNHPTFYPFTLYRKIGG